MKRSSPLLPRVLCIMGIVLIAASMLTLMSVVPASASYPTLQYDAQRTGDVPGLAPETSNLLWTSPVETRGCIEAGPIIHNGRVYISNWYAGWEPCPNATSAFYCLDEQTGDIIWMNSNISGASTAAVSGDKIFVGTLGGNITCVNATTGEIIWSKTIEKNPSGYGVTSSPLVLNGKVYALTFSDGTLHVFSLKGIELWNFSTGGEIFPYASPSAYADKIFFAGNKTGQHALYCLNSSTGEELWNFTTDTPISTPTVWSEEEMVFFTTKYVYGKEFGIYAVDANTGREIWHRKHYSSWASPALSDGWLYIGGSATDTTFYCYNALNRSLIWKNKAMSGAMDTSPVVADGKVYFGTSEANGTIYCLNAYNGSIIWNCTHYVPPGATYGFNVASHPVISNRTLFIGEDYVGVLAFRDRIFWEGNVTLEESTTFNVTAYNSGLSYEISNTTALGALNAAAKKGNFNYTVSDKWYQEYGSLYTDSIAGKWSAGMKGWLYRVDGTTPTVGVNQYEVEDGDTVTFYYGKGTTTSENSSMVIKIHVNLGKFLTPTPKSSAPGFEVVLAVFGLVLVGYLLVKMKK